MAIVKATSTLILSGVPQSIALSSVKHWYQERYNTEF